MESFSVNVITIPETENKTTSLLGQMLGWVEYIHFVETFKKWLLEVVDYSGVEILAIS